MDEAEVEREVELVVPRSVVPGPALDVENVCLADEDAGWVVGVGEPAPVAQDLVGLGSVHREDAVFRRSARREAPGP